VSTKTVRIHLSWSAVDDAEAELKSRVRLTTAVYRPAWWMFFCYPHAKVTGPADAVDAAVDAVETIKHDAWWADQW
jgi:hypothetical protein